MKIRNICHLNRSSKVCMEKGPARHMHTPLSSVPEPNTFFHLYCHIATLFLNLSLIKKEN